MQWPHLWESVASSIYSINVLILIGNLYRSDHSTSNIWIHSSFTWLAMVILDRTHRRRCILDTSILATRNIRTDPPRSACSKPPQNDRKPKYIRTHRARKERMEANGNCDTNATPPHALLRTHRPGDMSLSLARLWHLLHVLRSIPNHFPRHLRPISRSFRPDVPAHRWRHGRSDCRIPLVRLFPAQGTSTEQTMDAQRGVSTSTPRLCRWTLVRRSIILAGMDGR